MATSPAETGVQRPPPPRQLTTDICTGVVEMSKLLPLRSPEFPWHSPPFLDSPIARCC